LLRSKREEQTQEEINAFKKELHDAIDLLMKNDLPRLGDYITLKVELDPTILPLYITYQETLLLPVQLGLKVLR
jgi:hypothetical protein